MATRSNKVYFQSSTETGGSMSGLVADRERVRAALLLLLDKRWGLQRNEITRERIQLLPTKTRAFVGTAAPLNYLMEAVRDCPANKVPMLALLKKAETEHHKLWEKVRKENKIYTRKHDSLMANTREIRLCYQQAYAIKSLEIGKTLSKEMKKEVDAEYKAMWDGWRDELRLKHPTMKWQDFQTLAKKDRNERMQKLFDESFPTPREPWQMTKDERKLARITKKWKKLK
jgi:hypothetical protein